MADLASVNDLQVLMKRTFSSDDLAQANLVLMIVSSWARVASGQDWPDAPAGVPQDVVSVVLTASRREILFPDRITQETMGPFAVTYADPPPGFWLPGEAAILKRFRKSAGMFVVSSGRGETIGRFGAGFIYENGTTGDPIAYFAPGDPGWEESDHFNSGF